MPHSCEARVGPSGILPSWLPTHSQPRAFRAQGQEASRRCWWHSHSWLCAFQQNSQRAPDARFCNPRQTTPQRVIPRSRRRRGTCCFRRCFRGTCRVLGVCPILAKQGWVRPYPGGTPLFRMAPSSSAIPNPTAHQIARGPYEARPSPPVPPGTKQRSPRRKPWEPIRRLHRAPGRAAHG